MEGRGATLLGAFRGLGISVRDGGEAVEVAAAGSVASRLFGHGFLGAGQQPAAAAENTFEQGRQMEIGVQPGEMQAEPGSADLDRLEVGRPRPLEPLGVTGREAIGPAAMSPAARASAASNASRRTTDRLPGAAGRRQCRVRDYEALLSAQGSCGG
ncbi:MAG: hypothetical protein R3C69_15355 [Geminicoccaceae bacterium]